MAQRFRQPAHAVEKLLGLFGHLVLLEMFDGPGGILAPCLAHRLEDLCLGHPG